MLHDQPASARGRPHGRPLAWVGREAGGVRYSAVRLSGPLRLCLLKFFRQVGLVQAFKVLNNPVILRVAGSFNVRQKGDQLPALLG